MTSTGDELPQHIAIDGGRPIFCKRNEEEWLKCERFVLYHSTDAGMNWRELPMNRALWTKLMFAASEWPPIPRAFGCKNGKIAIAHEDFHEDGSPNFRFVSTFGSQQNIWTTKAYGSVTEYSEQWWSELPFDLLTSVNLLLRQPKNSSNFKSSSITKIDPAALAAYDPICKRSELQQIYYDKKDLYSSIDGGRNWTIVPWKMNYWNRIFRIFSKSGWPPAVQAFGWIEGNIAIAWASSRDDDEVNIAKCLAIYGSETDSWTFKRLGTFESLADFHWSWIKEIGFEQFNHANSIHATNTST